MRLNPAIIQLARTMASRQSAAVGVGSCTRPHERTLAQAALRDNVQE